MRIQIEPKREAVPQVVLNSLYKHTALQTTFAGNMVALVEGARGRSAAQTSSSTTSTSSARSSRAASEYELRRAETGAHILEGYLKALDNLDAGHCARSAPPPTSTRRARADGDAVRLPTEIQAQAILEMRPQRLTGLERERIEDEYNDLIRSGSPSWRHPRRRPRKSTASSARTARDQGGLRPERRPPHQIVAAEGELELED